MRTSFMLKSLIVAVLVGATGTAPAFAERVLTVSVQLDGREVLRTEYADDGAASPVEVWRTILLKQPRTEPEIADLPENPEDPLHVQLKGAIVLRIEAEGATLGEAKLKELALQRKNTSSRLWYLDSDEVYRTAYIAGLSDIYIGEWYYQRLTDPFEFRGNSYLGITWWFVLTPILLVAGVFIVWMYIKDSQSIRWYFAVPLAVLRATVYGLLAYMFLLPTLKETRIWNPRVPPMIEKHSRVVLLLDVSDSMANHSDDPASKPKRQTRLQKVVEFLSDDNAAFMKKLIANNPVFVYRFATELDTEVYSFKGVKTGGEQDDGQFEIRPFITRPNKAQPDQEETVTLARWTEKDWLNFTRYADFKPWLLAGLSPQGQKEIRADFNNGPGDADWAQAYLAASDDAIRGRLELTTADAAVFDANLKEARTQLSSTDADIKSTLLKNLSKEGQKELRADFPFDAAGFEWAETYLAAEKLETALARLKLSEEDATRFRANLDTMKKRIETARMITQGTDVVESVQRAFDAQKDKMLKGIIVISDGRSNVGADARANAKDDLRHNPALENLFRAAKKEQIPIVTIGIGEHREIKLVRITDLQAPEQTPPDDAFKIIVEVDGEHLKGESVDVTLELFPPDSDTPLELPGKVTFDQSEPPHGQFEWTINPPEILKLLGAELQKKNTVAELPEGIWKARAYTAKVNEDGKPDPKQRVLSELMPINIQKKSVRILLMASVANRDFQYLLTQLIRDKAEVSVLLQNDAGMFLDGRSISFLDDKYRHLSRFPDRLRVENDPNESAETKWYNLAKYDVIIAFDPDWTLLTEDQAKLIQTWVDLQAGGFLHVAGPINTKKLTFNENDSEVQRRLAPLLEIFPVTLGDNVLSKPRQDRNIARRLEFPGASPEMEFLRLDDDKPDNLLSGWEQFFTGKETREQGLTAELKRGFFDYYPVKDVKPGAAIVARYLEPQASENTFDKKDPPYIVTFKYGQGMTAFMGSSEIWRFNQYKDVYRERFWVKMSRYLASGSRKKQNRRGRILMSKEFVTGEQLRFTVQLLDASLKGLPASARPKFVLRPVELDTYPDSQAGKKEAAKSGEPADPQKAGMQRAEFLKHWTIEIELNDQEAKQTTPDGYFHAKRLLKAAEIKKRGLMQVQEERFKRPEVQAELDGVAKDFPSGIWRLEAAIPDSDESLTMKFVIRKPLPPEMVDLRPDFNYLAALSSDVREIEERLVAKKNVYQKLRDRAFASPSLDTKRLCYRFDDRESLELIPDAMPGSKSEIQNPQIEPEIRRSKVTPRWFKGPELPTWMTSWYDRSMEQPEQSHTVALWMLVCVSLLSLEWLTRKLLKLA